MGFLSSLSLPKADTNNYYAKKIQVDLADRLNWEVTVNLLVVCTLIVTNLKHFINKLISCTVPIHFSSNQEEYVNEVCFVSDKFFVLDTDRIFIYNNESSEIMPDGYTDDKVSLITAGNSQHQPPITSYYIFVPYLLMIEAFLIIIPRNIWSYFLNRLATFDVDEVLQIAHNCKNFSNKKFKQIYLSNLSSTHGISTERSQLADNEDASHFDHFNFLMNQIQRWTLLNFKHDAMFYLRRKYLCISYIAIKLLNIFNIFVFIFLIKSLLGISLFHIFYKIIIDLQNGIISVSMADPDKEANELDRFESFYLINSYYFPLRSMCTFKIRELAKTNIYAVMCALPINLFNQYIFMLILVWFINLLICNVYYLVYWLVHFQKFSGVNYTKERLINGLKAVGTGKKHNNNCNYLAHIYKKDDVCQECIHNFETFYDIFLSSDLILFLRILAINSSDILIQQIFVYLWKIYLQQFKGSLKTKRAKCVAKSAKAPGVSKASFPNVTYQAQKGEVFL